MPGEFRHSQNWIGGTRPGNATFVPPPPQQVADLLADLERFIHAEIYKARPDVGSVVHTPSPAANEFAALEEPLRRIAANAGQDGSVIVQKVRSLKRGQGYDAAADTYGDMVQLGIIDPAKVTKAALENAVSIAGMVLTTNCLVTDIPEKSGGSSTPSY